ncbi:MAG: oligosaccharide flippase family protein, partial [Rhodospirillales bacterium]|nr:oligosaccharide flippase family protein [Rhodospirillales bacterium]
MLGPEKNTRRIAKRLLAAPLRAPFLRSLAILSSAAVMQNLLVLAASPILSRLFSPDDFGSAGLLYALAAMPMTISSAHYYLAVTQTGKRVEWINIIALSLLCIAITCMLACIVVIIINYKPALGGNYGQQLGSLILLIPFSIMVEASLSVGRIWELRQANYRSLFRNRLIETVTMV